ncbi:unnamed protein product [Didymodactylos carnosus]|uniref:Glycosyltransferase n=1 Tax=Didymodactylos carnosus TaxID=1234261 RepID=A0A814YJW8_9BILA|nr:unnamed protein product [Didymodactylos carnosus]CAF1230068.1 unnamed protein product [Didymodactylos carnosus]CAF3756053.1 unnamed protein product [Didymodactylos carnosus]CAF3992795.1 unnamed protein product [Didymodactylos carnosus]
MDSSDLKLAIFAFKGRGTEYMSTEIVLMVHGRRLLYCLSSRRTIVVITIVLIVFTFASVYSIRHSSEAIKYFSVTDLLHTDFNTATKKLIPRLIHQTWRNHTIPAQWQDTVNSIHEYNTNSNNTFEYRLWTNQMIIKFMKENYFRFYQETFRKYPYEIQKIDAFRYFLMYHFGGVYIDMDIGCKKALWPLPQSIEHKASGVNVAVFPETRPFGVSNDFLISTVRHPLYEKIIHQTLSRWKYNFLSNYLTVMVTTGPLFLTLQLYLYPNKSDGTIYILEHALYNGRSQSFIRHTQVRLTAVELFRI